MLVPLSNSKQVSQYHVPGKCLLDVIHAFLISAHTATCSCGVVVCEEINLFLILDLPMFSWFYNPLPYSLFSSFANSEAFYWRAYC